jgi:predicted neuraminidase
LGPIKNKPVELNNGRWLCPCSTEDRGWQVHFEYSDDQGKTWHRSADVADPDQLSGIQPTVLETDVGLVALGRSQAGWVFATESADGGASWSPLKPLKVPNPNSGIDAVTMIDGRHALILNPVGNRPNQNNGRRTPLELALSSDTQTWQTVAVLETKPGEYSYPAIIQAGDGRLHVSYTWQRKKIKHVIIQPPALAN